MDSDYREADFGMYCNACKHRECAENDMPCCECLDTPVNLYSSRPIKFEWDPSALPQSKWQWNPFNFENGVVRNGYEGRRKK